MIPASSLAYGVDPVIGIPVVILLLLFSAFFSGSEAALFSLQAVERESIRHKGSAGQRVSRLLEAPRRTLASVLMGNELANVTLSTVCAGMVLNAWPNSPWMNFVLATPLLVLFGEITPKTLALRHNSLFARTISLPLQAWATLVSPFRWILTGIADATIRLLGGSASDLVSTIGVRMTATASTIPTTPATAVATTLSRRTAVKIRPAVAPKLRRTPISRMRWRMATSCMLTSPNPPSTRISTAIEPVTSSNIAADACASGRDPQSVREADTCTASPAAARTSDASNAPTVGTISSGTQSSNSIFWTGTGFFSLSTILIVSSPRLPILPMADSDRLWS